jgi:hypothetical protein
LPDGVNLRVMSSSLHADTHIDAGEFLTTQQQNGSNALYRRISGSTNSMGQPLILIKSLPRLQ